MTFNMQKAHARAFHHSRPRSPNRKRPPHFRIAGGNAQGLLAQATLDSRPAVAKNAPVAFNSATEIGVSITKADSRPTRHFLRPSHTIGASFSMAGRGGSVHARAGSLVRYANPAMRLPPPDWRREAGLTLTKDATMPKSFRRALRTLFPVVASPVSTLPTQAEAHALAALLTAQGKRAVFHRTTQGFAVEVVA